MKDGSFPLALVLSGVVHVLWLGAALTPLEAHAEADLVHTDLPAADPWTGESFDIELIEQTATSARSSTRHAAASGLAALSPPEPAPTPSPAPTPALAPAPTPSPAPSPATEPSPSPTETHAPAPEGPASAAASATESAPAEAPPAEGAASSFGAEGTGSAVRDLGRAFTRALPAAALGRDGWLEAPLGKSAEVEVALTLNDSGQLIELEIDESASRPLEALLGRVRLLLQRGHFAIDAAPVAGTAVLGVAVEVTEGEPGDPLFAEPTHVMQRGFEPPTRDESGRAHFTFASGRRVILQVSRRE